MLIQKPVTIRVHLYLMFRCLYMKRTTEVDALLANYSKANKILKWEPKISFDNLVKGMVESDLEFITNHDMS